MSSPRFVDDPEKGTSSHLELLPIPPRAAEEKVPVVSLQGGIPTSKGLLAGKPVARKVSRWIRFQLWFNTYRYGPRITLSLSC